MVHSPAELIVHSTLALESANHLLDLGLFFHLILLAVFCQFLASARLKALHLVLPNPGHFRLSFNFVFLIAFPVEFWVNILLQLLCLPGW